MFIALRLARDDAAATAAEYALLLAIVGGGVALAAVNLGTAISCSMERSGQTIARSGAQDHPNYGKSNPSGLAKGHRSKC